MQSSLLFSIQNSKTLYPKGTLGMPSPEEKLRQALLDTRWQYKITVESFKKLIHC